jgi:peptidoglycan hydrolase-like protein with peptidoglycan-binding domain
LRNRMMNVMLLFVMALAIGQTASPTPAANVATTPPPGTVIVDRTDFPALYLTEPNLQGQAVWMIQARLKEIGYDIEPSGVYDAITAYTVKLFQLAHGMVDDGIVNKDDWLQLMPQEPDASCITTAPAARDRMLIVIDVKNRTLVLYNDKEVICKYPVAVGKSSTPTPLGEWRVVQKSLNWGDGFGTRWMGLNVPWGIFGIHGTNKPGSIGTYASHGCIRMFNRDVEKLYPLVPNGCRVKIVKDGSMVPQEMKPIKMKKGSTGQAVVYVQARIKQLGVEFDNADGRYGNATVLAVKYYQAWHGLKPSGEMDEATYRLMGLIK